MTMVVVTMAAMVVPVSDSDHHLRIGPRNHAAEHHGHESYCKELRTSCHRGLSLG
jgi:hypothetical protein